MTLCEGYRNWLLGLTLGWTSIASSILVGSPIETTGLSSRGVSLGNALTAGGDPATAAYYNPAALTDASDLTMSFNYLVTDFQLNDINRKAAPGPSQLTPDDYRASQAKNSQGIGFGLNLPLFSGVNFGLAGYLPANEFARLTGHSKRQAAYVRYAQRSARPLIYSAVAKEIGYGFSLGIGASYTLQAKQAVQLALSQEDSDGRFQFEMEPVISPFAGVHWKKTEGSDRFAAGLTYRQGQSTPSTLDAAIALNLGPTATFPLQVESELIPFFDPTVWALGFSWKRQNDGFYFDLSRSLWSEYSAPSIRLRGKDIATLTGGGSTISEGLKDTNSYKFGYEHLFNGSRKAQTAVRMGLEQHDSAARSKNTTLLDTRRTVLSLGAGFMTPFKVQGIERQTTTSLTLQSSLLEKESFTNLENNKVVAGGSAFTLVGGFQYDM